MVQTILFISLILLLVLFLVQSVRLRSRNLQISRLMEHFKELDKQAGLGRLLMGIAHDLNTPLGALGCALHTRRQALDKLRGILESENGSAADAAGVQKALAALENTQGVVDASLERSHEMLKNLRRAGRGEPEGPVVVAARDVMDGTLLLLDHQFKSGITVVNELDPELQVRVQPGRLGRVFMNLLVNAHEAMGGEGEIRIGSRRESDTVFIIVSDNGPGLPNDGEASLFCSGWTTKGYELGSGLGLYISREIMRGFGGDVTAANSRDGGAEMTVRLPAAVLSPAGDGQ